MNYNVRISDNFLRGDHVDGEVLQHTDLNELENVAKTAINANYEDIQKLQDGVILSGNAEKLDGATLSKFATETLQNSDTKVPTSSQVKQYVDGAISTIDLDGYYTKREIDETLEDYTTFDDYASPSKTGVIKIDYDYGTDIDSETGVLKAGWDGYLTYQNRDNKCFISKGTLENVIEGKALTNKTYVDTALNGKVDKVTGKGLSTNDYTNDEKSKLSGIETGAQVNKIETIKVNGTSQEISSKTVNIPVPTKTSDLTNDSGYVKNTDYANSSTGGVIKVNSTTGGTALSNGVLVGNPINYNWYQNHTDNYYFITKGTLENVIAGKGLATKEDLPIKEYKDVTQANALNFNTMDAGLYYTDNCYITIGDYTELVEGLKLWCLEEYDEEVGLRYVHDYNSGVTYTIYKDGDNYTYSFRQFVFDDMLDYMLSFYATKSYVDGLVGDINTAIDNINGEVI